MPISEKFKNFKDQDPQIKAVDSAKRNFEIGGHSGAKLIIELGYFEILKELLQLFPGGKVGAEAISGKITGLTWQRENKTVNFGLAGLENDREYPDDKLYIGAQEYIGPLTISRSGMEIIPRSKLNKEAFEDAIFSVLTQAGFQVRESIRERVKETAKESSGEHFKEPQDETRTSEEQEPTKPDDFHRYCKVLKLDPEAFEDLSKEEGDELLKKTYEFSARKNHPDRGGDDEKMKEINNARDFFSDPNNRIPKSKK
jgi:hypothetical protein